MMAWLHEQTDVGAAIAILLLIVWMMSRIRDVAQAMDRIGRAAETLDKLLSEQLERERKAAKKNEAG